MHRLTLMKFLLSAQKQTPPFLIYGASFCRPCTKAKKMLDSKSISYKYVNTEEETAFLELEDLKKKYKWDTIPMIFFKGEFIGGYTDLLEKIQNKQIDLDKL